MASARHPGAARSTRAHRTPENGILHPHGTLVARSLVGLGGGTVGGKAASARGLFPNTGGAKALAAAPGRNPGCRTPPLGIAHVPGVLRELLRNQAPAPRFKSCFKPSTLLDDKERPTRPPT